jgi:hypothetical protein
MLVPPSKLVEQLITRSNCIRFVRFYQGSPLSAATDFQRHALLATRSPGTRSVGNLSHSLVSRRLHSFRTPVRSASASIRSKQLAPVRIPSRSTSVRYCSARRKMCKLYAGAEVAGGLDVSKGREILPANVRPINYDLTLEPNFKKFTYQGSVTIE